MSRQLRCFLVAALAIAGNVARAQSSSPQDSAIVHHVGAAILRELSYGSVQGAFADSLRPVQISFPAGPAWARLQRHVLLSLHGRSPRPGDRLKEIVVVDEVSMRRDTLVAHFSIGQLRKCGNAWVGDRTRYEARAVRHGAAWEPVVTKPVLYSDGPICRLTDHD
jgi:hypothetical protein